MNVVRGGSCLKRETFLFLNSEKFSKKKIYSKCWLKKLLIESFGLYLVL